MGATKVAVVTGANKGIGYEIVKGLCERFDGKVYLTARDAGRGKEAVRKLKELGLNPVFHQLDINDQRSIDRLRDDIRATDGGVDLLINNAAILYLDSREPFSRQAEVTVQVNYFSTLHVCQTLFPILRPKAQIINLSSELGHLSRLPSAELRSKFKNPYLTIEAINELMNQFISDAKDGKHRQKGWGGCAYTVSKIGVSALTMVQQKEFDNEPEKRDISVNSVHPGYCATDMSAHMGPLTAEEGSRAPLFLALENHGHRGKYIWRDSTVADWFASSTPAPY